MIHFLNRYRPTRALLDAYRHVKWFYAKPLYHALTRRAPGRRRPRVLFYPEAPRQGAVLLQIAALNGYKILTSPRRRFDVAVHHEYGDQSTFERFARDLPTAPRTVNARFRDIRKQTVADVFGEVAGYPLSLDPLTHHGLLVRKSDANSTHDGAVLEGPLERVEAGFVYQKFADALADDGTVHEVRVPIVRDSIPFVYLKRRPAKTRFQSRGLRSELRETADLLSDEEVAMLLRFCARLGLDYGELDVLRDNGDGRIYVVDANFTPTGPARGVSRDQGRAAIARLARAFDEAFVA